MQILIIILSIICIFVIFSNTEQLTNEPSILDNIIVKETCQNMTPIKLYGLFNNNIELMTKTVIENGLSTQDLADPENYPKIATYLSNKNIISC
jgi:tyrosine-protein phosphatase YwqE